jgi:uncharacterized protein (TIGR00297 family)
MLLTVAFTALALRVRGVTPSGAVAGAVVAFSLYVGGGPGAFALLVCVFAITWTTTRVGYARKQRLGTAEKRGGRSASQVLANLAVPAGAAVFSAVTQWPEMLLVMMTAALAEAAADTASSELGQALSDRAYLITTMERVPPGTDGGISLPGTAAAIASATVVALLAAAVRVIGWDKAALATGAALAGTVVDSLLGAVLERRGMLGNDAVNLLSTMVAALAAGMMAI